MSGFEEELPEITVRPRTPASCDRTLSVNPGTRDCALATSPVPRNGRTATVRSAAVAWLSAGAWPERNIPTPATASSTIAPAAAIHAAKVRVGRAADVFAGRAVAVPV